jgi:arylsulfatase A-like enzyme
MREKDLLDRTLVIITSDHGEEFFEHGKKGHQKGLHDEVLKVPLILRLPGTIPEGKRIDTQVRTVDIYPTILDMVGVESPSPVMGQSLVDCWTRDADVPPAISELDLGPAGPRLRSLRTSTGKLIRDLLFGTASFYDLKADPGETSALEPEEDVMADLRRMEKVLEDMKGVFPDRASGSIPDLDPEVLDHLRSLGYFK